MHKGSSLIDSTRIAIAKTSWKVVFPSWAIFAHFHSCFSHQVGHTADHHSYEPASETPHLAHIPAEFLPGGSLAITGGLGCSPILPLPECLLLDEGGEQMRESIVTLGQRGNAPLWSFSIELLECRGLL